MAERRSGIVTVVQDTTVLQCPPPPWLSRPERELRDAENNSEMFNDCGF